MLVEVEMKEQMRKLKTDQNKIVHQSMGDYQTRNVAKTIELNDMYVDAVKAKLKILEQI